MSGIYAVVPAKCFAHAKTRLAGTLSAARRERLARGLCDHVVSTALASTRLAGVLVLTDCPHVAEHARRLGAEPLRDRRVAPLGLIVDDALASLAARGAAAAIVLMADLPAVSPADLDALLDPLDDCDLVLAPDRAGEGTNALGARNLAELRSSFGHRDSFTRHVTRAAASEGRVVIVERPGLAWDVDTPADLTGAIQRGASGSAGLAFGGRFSAIRSLNRKRSSRVSAA